MPKARKRSADPAQQALRDHKSEWNSAVKDFIAHLIAAKQGINGRGSAKANIPPSNIKDPLPGEIGTLLNALTSQFQSLVGDGNAIISEQSNYSKNRRKKQDKSKQINQPEIKTQISELPAQQEQILQNIAAQLSNNNIIKVAGSNRFSRMWEYIASTFKRDADTKKRVGLLALAADIFYDFLDLENDVLSLNLDSVPTAVSKFQMISYNVEALKQAIVGPPKDEEEQKKDREDAIKRQLKENPAPQPNPISEKLDNKTEEKPNTEQQKLINDIVKSEASTDIYEIIKLSHNYVSRLLKKYWVSLSKSNRTAAHRLNVAKRSEIIRKILQEMMSGLEKELNEQTLIKQAENIEQHMQIITHDLHILNVMYRQKFYEDYNKLHKDKKHPGKNILFDRVWQEEIRKDLRRSTF